MRLTASGNVGIGTTTPSRKLEIYSSTDGTTVAGLKLKNQGVSIDTASAIDFDFFGSDSIGARIAGIRTNAGNFESALAFYTNTGASGSSISEAMRINRIGNVGIGTATPTAKLQVAGDIIVRGTSPKGVIRGDNYSKSVPQIQLLTSI
jgi:hypothetical protein